MALKIIGKIILYEPLNQDKIDAVLAGDDTVILEIERRYKIADKPEILSAVLPTQFEGISVDYIEALKLVFDASTWIHEENVVMYKILYNETTKVFDLTNSYIRNDRDTTSAMGSVASGQLLQAVFTTQDISGVSRTVIDLPYGEVLDIDQLNILKDKGIVINTSSTGDLITVSNQSIPYKVEYVQPSSVVGVAYNIEFELQNKIIEIWI